MPKRPILCPQCGSAKIIKKGKNGRGVQMFRCQDERCPQPNFAAWYYTPMPSTAEKRAAYMRKYRRRMQQRLHVYHRSKTTEWETPQTFFDAIDTEFHFTLDPCATWHNAKCARYFTAEDDGIVQPWDDEVVFMNPPYGRSIGVWMAKAYDSAILDRATVVCLVPVRTDTKWWQEYALRGEVRFLPGRIKFVGANDPAPFPSALVIFRPPSQKETPA